MFRRLNNPAFYRRAVSPVASIAAANVGSSGITFIAVMVIGFVLSASQFGVFFYAYTAMQLGVQLADARTQTQLVLGRHGVAAGRLWRTASVSTAAAGAALLHGGLRISVAVLISVAISAYMQSELNFELNRLIGTRKLAVWSISSVLANGGKAALMISATIWLRGVVWILIGYTVACAATSLALIVRRRSETTMHASYAASGSKWLVASNLLTGIHGRIDPFLLSFLGASAGEISSYGKFLLILGGQLLVLSSFVYRVMPMAKTTPVTTISKYSKQGLVVMLFTGMLILGGLSATAPLGLFPSVLPLYLIVASSVVFSGYTVPMSSVVYHGERPSVIASINTAELTVSVGISAILVSVLPPVIAVASARGLSYFVGSILTMSVIRRMRTCDSRKALSS